MATASYLETLLGDWKKLLTDWATSGQLTAAAQDALQLSGEPKLLQKLVGQWSKGDYSGLPPIVLFPSSSMPGAAGAYAISTGTIYLNQDWLQTASNDSVLAVLTEELGHHLDGLLNPADTPGDEGEAFAALLTHTGTASAWTYNDQSVIDINGQLTQAELAALPPTPITSVFGTTAGEAAFGITNTSDGGLYITGNTTSASFDGQSGAGGSDSFLRKINSDGSVAWTRLLGTSSGEIGLSVDTDSSNNAYICGNISGAGLPFGGNIDCFAAKYSPDGTLQWQTKFGTSGLDEANAIAVPALGITYIVGNTTQMLDNVHNVEPYGSDNDIFIKALNANGSSSGTRIIGSSGYDYGTGIAFAQDGSYIIAGYTDGNLDGQATDNLYSTDAFIIKYNTDHTKAWTRLIESQQNGLTAAYCTTIGSDSSIYVAGEKSDGLSTESFVAKYSPTGNQEWLRTFGTPQNDRANGIAVGKDGNIYVTGYQNSNLYTATTPNNPDIYTACFLPNGTNLWTYSADSGDADIGRAVTTDIHGSVNVAGSTRGVLNGQPNSGQADACILRFPAVSQLVSLSSQKNTVIEDGLDSIVVQFSRSGDLVNTLAINLGISGTADYGTDYTQAGAASFSSANGVISFAPGSSTATLTLDPIADTVVESDETVVISLLAGSGYSIGGLGSITSVITNDDLPKLFRSSASSSNTVVEGSSANTNANLTVTLDAASSQPITVDYATANGTAFAGADYTATTGTLTIAAGQTSGTISIPILNDNVSEANESFTVQLSNPVNATLSTNSASVTITDTLTSAVTATLPAGVENLTLTGSALADGTGNAGPNVLTGNSAANTLTGLAGNDTYRFVTNIQLGSDTVTEAAIGGTDTINLASTTSAVRLNLGITTLQTINANLKLTITNANTIENAIGGNSDDVLTGNALGNTLTGGTGADRLSGLPGNDLLDGGLGNDLLTGGVGIDRFRFASGAAFATTIGNDYLTDFTSGEDKIELSKKTFSAITTAAGSPLTSFATVSDDALVDSSSSVIIYSSSSGGLFYNMNGATTGDAAKVFEFASLGNVPATLLTTDFTVIT